MALRLVGVVLRLVVTVIKVPAMKVNVAAVVAKSTEVTKLIATAVMAMNVLVPGGTAWMTAVVLMTLLKLRETTQLKVRI